MDRHGENSQSTHVPCSSHGNDDEHIYETAYFTRPIAQLSQIKAEFHEAESRQKSFAKEYYEMRGTPQNTLETNDKQQLKY